jgi:hypothetical protein
MSKDSYILLDLDGVMITTPPWEVYEPLHDGFLDFNTSASQELNYILKNSKANILLISSHRVNFTHAEWFFIFKRRGIDGFKKLEILPSEPSDKIKAVEEWIYNNSNTNYVIIDDDKRFFNLPKEIRERVVSTSFSMGLTKKDSLQALDVLGLQDTEHKFLRHLIDIVWNDVTESKEVPSTLHADKLIQKAKESFYNGKISIR